MTVSILYTNHRGETATRRITPSRLWFGATEWHAEEQWILDAFDEDRGAVRSFAMKDIRAWGPAEAAQASGKDRTPEAANVLE